MLIVGVEVQMVVRGWCDPNINNQNTSLSCCGGSQSPDDECCLILKLLKGFQHWSVANQVGVHIVATAALIGLKWQNIPYMEYAQEVSICMHEKGIWRERE